LRIILDQGTPVPLRHHLAVHSVQTAYELGWSALSNGELLEAAEKQFDLLVTTDRNLRYQQKLVGRSVAILVLPTANWPHLRERISDIVNAIGAIKKGEYRELE
jgi:hypothetical protein